MAKKKTGTDTKAAAKAAKKAKAAQKTEKKAVKSNKKSKVEEEEEDLEALLAKVRVPLSLIHFWLNYSTVTTRMGRETCSAGRACRRSSESACQCNVGCLLLRKLPLVYRRRVLQRR